MSPRIFNGDCIDEMKKLPDNSVDMVWTDLPYATKTFGKCVDCEWDNAINLPAMWDEFMRIKKDAHTPIFFSCNVKLGYDLIRTAPKKCPFRYDLIWVKSAPTSFLSARRMPMRKHELIYVFYERLPFYDLSSHTHKFKKTKPRTNKNTIYGVAAHQNGKEGSYNPPLPLSVIKNGNKKQLEEGVKIISKAGTKSILSTKEQVVYGYEGKKGSESHYDPPLPKSVIISDKKVETMNYKSKDTIYGEIDVEDFKGRNGKSRYDPPLPKSVIICDNKVDAINTIYGSNHWTEDDVKKGGHKTRYDPPLPKSVLKEYPNSKIYGNVLRESNKLAGAGQSRYDPPLPTSVNKTDIYGMNHKECQAKGFRNKKYEPPLPTSVNKEWRKKEDEKYTPPSIKKRQSDCYNVRDRIASGKLKRGGNMEWEPKLPVSYIDGTTDEICPVCSHYPDTILDIKSKKGKHSTQKPVDLIKWCLKYYSREGDVILDCCMGSGSTGVACVEMGREFIGIELDEDIFKVATERVMEAKLI